MIRRNASLVLAIAILALGAAQASAELITIDPASSEFTGGQAIQWIAAPSGSISPAVQLFVNAQSQTTVTFSSIPNVMINRVAEGSYFAGITNLAATVESWQGGWMTGANPDNAGYQLTARFREYETTTYVPVSYVEVDFEANSWGDKGWVRAYNAAGTLLGDVIVDLTAGPGTTGTAILDADDLGAQIAYITATAYGSGVNVLIGAIRYGDGPEEPVLVPEPTSMISLLLGCFGLAWVRRRRA